MSKFAIVVYGYSDNDSVCMEIAAVEISGDKLTSEIVTNLASGDYDFSRDSLIRLLDAFEGVSIDFPPNHKDCEPVNPAEQTDANHSVTHGMVNKEAMRFETAEETETRRANERMRQHGFNDGIRRNPRAHSGNEFYDAGYDLGEVGAEYFAIGYAAYKAGKPDPANSGEIDSLDNRIAAGIGYSAAMHDARNR